MYFKLADRHKLKSSKVYKVWLKAFPVNLVYGWLAAHSFITSILDSADLWQEH
jgi:hypothetical protein